jgi:hypothetical protein
LSDTGFTSSYGIYAWDDLTYQMHYKVDEKSRFQYNFWCWHLLNTLPQKTGLQLKYGLYPWNRVADSRKPVFGADNYLANESQTGAVMKEAERKTAEGILFTDLDDMRTMQSVKGFRLFGDKFLFWSVK